MILIGDTLLNRIVSCQYFRFFRNFIKILSTCKLWVFCYDYLIIRFSHRTRCNIEEMYILLMCFQSHLFYLPDPRSLVPNPFLLFSCQTIKSLCVTISPIYTITTHYSLFTIHSSLFTFPVIRFALCSRPPGKLSPRQSHIHKCPTSLFNEVCSVFSYF